VKIAGKLQPLWEYLERCWFNCVDMWASYSRLTLPIMYENTTNRVERFFGCLKDRIRRTFAHVPHVAMLIIFLIDYVEQAIREKEKSYKRLRPFDADYGSEIKEASNKLTRFGVSLFHLSLTKLKSQKMKMLKNGVKETFTNTGQSKVYDSSGTSCNCTFFFQCNVPCRHILFLRQQIGFALFDLELFPSKFHLTEDPEPSNEPVDAEIALEHIDDF
jgi:hypothetical protein